MINCTEHKGKLEFIKRIPRTHTRGKGPVRFVLRIDGYRVTTKPFDPIVNKIPDLVGKECVAVIGVWHSINVLGSIKLAADVTPEGNEDDHDDDSNPGQGGGNHGGKPDKDKPGKGGGKGGKGPGRDR